MKILGLLLGMLFLLSSCAKDYTKALSQLRVDLKQTNDTVYAYSMKNHYALWIHTDKPNTQTDGPSDRVYSLYYCDLETGIKEKLFTTGTDTLIVMPNNVKHVVYNPVNLHFSEDSCALIIEDGAYVTTNFISLYPLVDSDRKTLYFLAYGDLEDVKQAPNLYKGQEFTKLSYGDYLPAVQLEGADISWPPTHCWRDVIYNTKGEITSYDSEYYTRYGNYAMREFQDFPISASILHDPAQLSKYLISTRAYTIDDLYQLYNNRIKFRQVFGSEEDKKQEFFLLNVLQVDEAEFDDESVLLVKGDGFTIITKDMKFADLTYPAEVTIRSNLIEMSVFQEIVSNPYFPMFGLMIPNMTSFFSNLEGDFVFGTGELLFY